MLPQTGTKTLDTATNNSFGELCFAHISDTHFSQRREQRSTKVEIPNFDPVKRSDLILQAIAAEQGLDFLIHGGDVVDREAVKEYTAYDRLFNDLLPKLDCHYVVGNHDNGKAMVETLRMGTAENVMHDDDKFCYTFRHGPHHFIIVDGRISDSSLAQVGNIGRDWLRERLAAIPHGEFAWPILHFPVVLHSKALKPRLALMDGKEVEDIFLSFTPNIRLVLHGHLHQVATYGSPRNKELTYFSAPSASHPLKGQNGTGYSYDPHGTIGYELVRLHVDGTWDIELKSVDVSSSLI